MACAQQCSSHENPSCYTVFAVMLLQRSGFPIVLPRHLQVILEHYLQAAPSGQMRGSVTLDDIHGTQYHLCHESATGEMSHYIVVTTYVQVLRSWSLCHECAQALVSTQGCHKNIQCCLRSEAGGKGLCAL